MITYSYRCNECRIEWEEKQRITDPVYEQCPECKKITAQRVIGKTNFVLKGNDWYNSTEPNQD